MAKRFRLPPAVHHRLQSWGIEFWLPLPFLAIVFWLGMGVLTDWVLGRPYGTENRLQTNPQSELDLANDIAFIEATIHPDRSKTQVEVQRIGAGKVEFEVTDITFDQIETAIARELGLSMMQVRQITRYEIVEGVTPDK
jgi:hypothetical protein